MIYIIADLKLKRHQTNGRLTGRLILSFLFLPIFHMCRNAHQRTSAGSSPLYTCESKVSFSMMQVYKLTNFNPIS